MRKHDTLIVLMNAIILRRQDCVPAFAFTAGMNNYDRHISRQLLLPPANKRVRESTYLC